MIRFAPTIAVLVLALALNHVHVNAQNLPSNVGNFEMGGQAFRGDFLNSLEPHGFSRSLSGNAGLLDAKGLTDFVVNLESLSTTGAEKVKNSEITTWSFAGRDCGGCDEQVVSPSQARSKFGGTTSAAEIWKSRSIAEDEAAIADEKVTCDAAVEIMFDTICGGDTGCVIEEEYKELCVRNHQNTPETLKACLSVEDTYVASCFGTGEFLKEAQQLSLSGWLSDESNQAICSATVATMPENFLPSNQQDAINLAFTASHCMGHVGSQPHVAFWSAMSAELASAPADSLGDDIAEKLDPKITTFDFNASFEIAPLSDPILFAPTAFCGLNAISKHRREMAKMNSLSEWQHGGKCDTSSLCTIVAQTGTKLFHTCQTTRGGSGGALIQKHEDQYVIVGINEGSDATGEVASNIGTSFR